MKMFLVSLMVAIGAMASVEVYYPATTFLGSQRSLSCGTGLTCAKAAGKMNITTVGAVENAIAGTTSSITAAQCGSTFVSDSADVMTLPEASTVLGCRLTFICGTADDFDVNPADGTDLISVYNYVAAGTGAAVTPSAGDAIRCTDIGSSFTLQAIAADRWAMIGTATGAVTDVN